MTGFEAIVFDLDGVLWHSSPAHSHAYREVLQCVPGFDIESFDYSAVAGLRTDEAFMQLFGDAGISVDARDIARLVAKKREIAYLLLEKASPLAADCQQTIRNLSGRARLAIASSSSDRNVELFLKASGTAPCFHLVLSGESVLHAKPHPAIYQEALKRLEVAPESVLVVEDSISGVQSAIRAGVRVAAIEGTAPANALMLAGASWVLASLTAVEGVA
jgi:HAD superfamily hydrolase (TIGR01509 family)